MRFLTTAFFQPQISINYARRDVSINEPATLPKQAVCGYYDGDFACSAGLRLIEYAQILAKSVQMAYIFIP
jgi:hypothetical protein